NRVLSAGGTGGLVSCASTGSVINADVMRTARRTYRSLNSIGFAITAAAGAAVQASHLVLRQHPRMIGPVFIAAQSSAIPNRARSSMNFPYQAMLAETVTFKGHNGDLGEAYFARPLGPGPFPGVVIIHHMPGWDEWIKEVPRKLAYHGFLGIAPHLYFREGPGDPDDIGARVRAAGGVSDEQVIGDVAGSMEYLRALPYSNGKVAVMGFCSGGRHTYLVA